MTHNTVLSSFTNSPPQAWSSSSRLWPLSGGGWLDHLVPIALLGGAEDSSSWAVESRLHPLAATPASNQVVEDSISHGAMREVGESPSAREAATKRPGGGGYYHGKLIFPREFPFKPPSIYMITPNGRFKCNTRLCLSITDFHPDTWNPAWSVSTILTGLLSFMVEKGPTLGSIETSDFTKRQLAAQSLAFNTKDKVFCELFPDVVQEIKQKQKAQQELSNRPQALPLPDVIPDGEVHNGQNGIPLLNGHAELVGANNQGLQPNRNHGLLGGALANLFVIVGFAAFAYTVKYVLRSIAQE
ncbi:UB2J2 enzyme, partial [Polypterus senegalus]